MTGDVDLFLHDGEQMRFLVAQLPEIARKQGLSLSIQRDAGHLVRARVEGPEGGTEIDIVHEPLQDLEAPPPPLEGVVVESLPDLRASKLTCLLSRSEPRDLVDLLFLDKAGYPPEADMELALRKDSGIDPGILAWLLAQFPTTPLPQMLEPLSEEQLLQFRDELALRFKKRVTQE
jgi:hypothetical protein